MSLIGGSGIASVMELRFNPLPFTEAVSIMLSVAPDVRRPLTLRIPDLSMAPIRPLARPLAPDSEEAKAQYVSYSFKSVARARRYSVGDEE